MTVTMPEHESYAINPSESGVRGIGTDERVLELHGRNDLGELVLRGRVRLYDADGSMVEISHPTREAWRDPEGLYHVRLAASLSNEMKLRYPDPIPGDATTVVYQPEIVEAGSELFGGEVFYINGTGTKPWQSVLLRNICKVELIVPRGDEPPQVA